MYHKIQIITRFGYCYDKDMCNGLGKHRVKLMLNSLIKKGDLIAALYRCALEVENCNLDAKKYRDNKTFKYRTHLYNKKHDHLVHLVELVEEYNKRYADEIIVYGIQDSDCEEPPYIIYFELPGMEQISFHTYYLKDCIPTYPNEWDYQLNSTLYKIEKAITHRYGDVIKSRYGIGGKKKTTKN